MAQDLAFHDLGLSEGILNSIQKKGFTKPSDIQARIIPIFFNSGVDIIAQAATGTGKTGAFGIPMIEKIEPNTGKVQAMILVPTRELAMQVTDELNSLASYKSLKIIPIYGGKSMDDQMRSLKSGIDIVVGTPGRVMDHIRRKTLKLKSLSYLVLDEADEMLNMGFIQAIEEIMTYTNPEKRTLLFSATMPQKIKYLAKNYLHEHEHIAVTKDLAEPNLTTQFYYTVKESEKVNGLCHIIDFEPQFYGMVFCRTKRNVDTVVHHMINRGYKAEGIHGDKSQSQREFTLDRFKKRKINVLVCSDVAARGIDVNDLTHVVNYSIPQDAESYVHRIGRTGRAGKEGTAVTFVTPAEQKRFSSMIRSAKVSITKKFVPGIEEIINKKKQIIADSIFPPDTEPNVDPSYFNWAKELLQNSKPTEVLAGVLSYAFKDRLDPAVYQPVKGAENSRSEGSRRSTKGKKRSSDKTKKNKFAKKTRRA